MGAGARNGSHGAEQGACLGEGVEKLLRACCTCVVHTALACPHALRTAMYPGAATPGAVTGGEKRRLSLGMEMVTEPAVLFLDESSSGLDSFTAFKVGRGGFGRARVSPNHLATGRRTGRGRGRGRRARRG